MYSISCLNTDFSTNILATAHNLPTTGKEEKKEKSTKEIGNKNKFFSFDKLNFATKFIRCSIKNNDQIETLKMAILSNHNNEESNKKK